MPFTSNPKIFSPPKMVEAFRRFEGQLCFLGKQNGILYFFISKYGRTPNPETIDFISSIRSSILSSMVAMREGGRASACRKRRRMEEGMDFQVGIQQHPREQIPLFFVRGKQTENCGTGMYSERAPDETRATFAALAPSTAASERWLNSVHQF
ncbi:hypothetical protein WN51_08184 [Melipona quadrifasciata]|uniref:Uncharacterized protein n=1 Tax=Melipona quadrifasciata TaxID=166423 RepID=A0A0M8ZNP8_9HYME|nr:hypothetical protein WN51_08184 [Melipona quadrifasciata]